MTCCAAKIYKDKIVVGADSGNFMEDGHIFPELEFIKMRRINNMIIAGAGQLEDIGLLFIYAKNNVPVCAEVEGVIEFISNFYKFKEELQIGENTSKSSSRYYIAYKGKLFTIEDCFVHEIKTFDAMGSGMECATTALYLGKSVKEALRITSRYCVWVREPINIMTMKR